VEVFQSESASSIMGNENGEADENLVSPEALQESEAAFLAYNGIDKDEYQKHSRRSNCAGGPSSCSDGATEEQNISNKDNIQKSSKSENAKRLKPLLLVVPYWPEVSTHHSLYGLPWVRTKVIRKYLLKEHNVSLDESDFSSASHAERSDKLFKLLQKKVDTTNEDLMVKALRAGMSWIDDHRDEKDSADEKRWHVDGWRNWQGGWRQWGNATSWHKWHDGWRNWSTWTDEDTKRGDRSWYQG